MILVKMNNINKHYKCIKIQSFTKFLTVINCFSTLFGAGATPTRVTINKGPSYVSNLCFQFIGSYTNALLNTVVNKTARLSFNNLSILFLWGYIYLTLLSEGFVNFIAERKSSDQMPFPEFMIKTISMLSFCRRGSPDKFSHEVDSFDLNTIEGIKEYFDSLSKTIFNEERNDFKPDLIKGLFFIFSRLGPSHNSKLFSDVNAFFMSVQSCASLACYYELVFTNIALFCQFLDKEYPVSTVSQLYAALITNDTSSKPLDARGCRYDQDIECAIYLDSSSDMAIILGIVFNSKILVLINNSVTEVSGPAINDVVSSTVVNDISHLTTLFNILFSKFKVQKGTPNAQRDLVTTSQPSGSNRSSKGRRDFSSSSLSMIELNFVGHDGVKRSIKFRSIPKILEFLTQLNL